MRIIYDAPCHSVRDGTRTEVVQRGNNRQEKTGLPFWPAPVNSTNLVFRSRFVAFGHVREVVVGSLVVAREAGARAGDDALPRDTTHWRGCGPTTYVSPTSDVLTVTRAREARDGSVPRHRRAGLAKFGADQSMAESVGTRATPDHTAARAA